MKIDKVRIHFSVGKGYYCTVDGNKELPEQFLAKVERRMRALEKRISDSKEVHSYRDAMECFTAWNV